MSFEIVDSTTFAGTDREGNPRIGIALEGMCGSLVDKEILSDAMQWLKYSRWRLISGDVATSGNYENLSWFACEPHPDAKSGRDAKPSVIALILKVKVDEETRDWVQRECLCGNCGFNVGPEPSHDHETGQKFCNFYCYGEWLEE